MSNESRRDLRTDWHGAPLRMAGGDLPVDYRRDDYLDHVTPVESTSSCRHCGAETLQRVEGRRREYCDRVCRQRAARARAAAGRKSRH